MNNRNQKAVALLRKAADTIEQRAQEYRGVGDMFDSIADRADTDVEVVFNVLIGTKQARIDANPEHLDSYIDLLAYTALSYCHVDCINKLVEEAKDKSAKMKAMTISNYRKPTHEEMYVDNVQETI
jgi:hypothetical protein